MDNEILFSGAARRSWSALPKVITRDWDEKGYDYLCGLNQPWPCSNADWFSTTVIGIPCGAVSGGEEFAQVVVGV